MSGGGGESEGCSSLCHPVTWTGKAGMHSVDQGARPGCQPLATRQRHDPSSRRGTLPATSKITMHIDRNHPALRRQRIRQALDAALICWAMSTAAMVAGALLYEAVR